MRILQASAEVQPFSKTGGLADMAAALAKSLGRRGHHVGIVTPFYRGVASRCPAEPVVLQQFPVTLGANRRTATIRSVETSKNVTVYFVEEPEYFDRPALYAENGVDYVDNAERFIFFSKCVAELAWTLPWKPEIVHAHDWHSALACLWVQRARAQAGKLDLPRTCFTIHNLAYQGVFPRTQFALLNLPEDYFSIDGVEFYSQLNCLKAGIRFADAVTTVSPSYAREILTPGSGCGLDGLLRTRAKSLFGISNGVDYEEWNTTRNPHLKNSYDRDDLRGKMRQKLALQAEMGLPVRRDVPIFGCVSRLTEQKGVDILLPAMEEMLAADLQFVLLGSGTPALEAAFAQLAVRHAGKVGATVGFDPGLAHRLEAGADFFLMPSRFEPCGLNQMYSQRYGTIPIVRATGGLRDTVVDLREDVTRATGIKFDDYTVPALAKAIRKALVLYGEKALLGRMQYTGMGMDYSWEETSRRYGAIYAELMAEG